MRLITGIDEIHDYLLNIAKILHQICTNNHISYYMAYGTMLGAIRHKGFIPWDDDMDFYVDRRDVSELKRCLAKELPSYLRLIDYNNSKEVTYDLLKIEDTRTTMIQKHKKNMSYASGIYIDIFILDHVENDFSFLSQNWIDFYLKKIQSARFLDSDDRPLKERLYSYLVKLFLYPLKFETIPDYINRTSQKQDGPFLYNHAESRMGRCFLPEVFGTPKLYDFEDSQLYGLCGYDEYLKTYYGDYMKLPPEDERETHIVNLYLKD